MIALERLIALAAGDDDEEADAHVLSCSACAATLERLLSIGDGVRELVGRGAVRFSASKELADELESAGLLKRIYRFQPGDIVACTAVAEDVFVAAFLHAELANVTRVDVVFDVPGMMTLRADDVPFDRERGLVIMLERGDFLRTLPTHVMKCEMMGDGNVIATYTFNHHATP